MLQKFGRTLGSVMPTLLTRRSAIKTLRISIPTLLLLAVATAFQEPQPIPPYEGDDNPQHDGQPAFCINRSTREHIHNCACKGMLADHNCEQQGGGENSKCAVYCRKNACRCESDCKTE